MDPLKFKLTIAYDGTHYAGWQVQKTGTGVQEKVEAALAKLFPSHPRALSCGGQAVSLLRLEPRGDESAH